jgi:hypothetical protein
MIHPHRQRGEEGATAPAQLPALQDTYTTRCHRKVKKIIKDNNHPSHCLFTSLSSRSQGQYRCIKAGTKSLKNSFCLKAIRLLSRSETVCGKSLWKLAFVFLQVCISNGYASGFAKNVNFPHPSVTVCFAWERLQTPHRFICSSSDLNRP